jgi:cytochrome c-type biogenesis protein CcmH
MLGLLYFLIASLLLVFLAIATIPVFLYKRKIAFKHLSVDIGIFSVAITLLPVIAIFLYAQWGASQQLAQFYAISKVAATMQQKQGGKLEVKEVIAKLVGYLNVHPNDAKGWYLLGRLYLDQNAIAKASESFKHSLANDPQNTEVMAQYAQALYLNDHHRLTPETMALIQKVLTEDSKNATLLNLLAMDAFTHRRYAVATTYWKRLRSQYPEDSQAFRSLTQAIEESEKNLHTS